MAILQNVIKIIVGIIGTVISGILMFYFVKVEGEKQVIHLAPENIIVDHENISNQVGTSFTGNNREEHVYDTMDLTGGDSECTVLLDEEHGEDTSLL